MSSTVVALADFSVAEAEAAALLRRRPGCESENWKRRCRRRGRGPPRFGASAPTSAQNGLLASQSGSSPDVEKPSTGRGAASSAATATNPPPSSETRWRRFVPSSEHVRVFPEGADAGRKPRLALRCGAARGACADKKSSAMPTARSGVTGAASKAIGRIAAARAAQSLFTALMILKIH